MAFDLRPLRVLTAAALLAIASPGQPACAAPIAAPVAVDGRALQRVLDQSRDRTGSPGASAAIMVDGKVVWSGSSGDSVTGVPVSGDTLYSLASVTKMFVATMVLRLAETGKLRLDDPIARYVPSYMPSTHEVTIKDLLGHTSGYPDVEGDAIVVRWLDDPNHRWDRAQILHRVRPVSFAPGTRFDYSNTNYVILGEIIDRASGSGVGDEFEKLLTSPLGLDHDADFERLPAYAPRIAHGYDLESGRLVDTFDGARDLGVPTGIWGTVWTDGGIVASATGVARFTDALYGGRILTPAMLAKMLAPGPNGSYGLGTLRSRFDGHVWQGHDGFYFGYTTESFYDFSRRLTITVLTNRTDDDDPAATIWDRLATAYDGFRPGR